MRTRPILAGQPLAGADGSDGAQLPQCASRLVDRQAARKASVVLVEVVEPLEEGRHFVCVSSRFTPLRRPTSVVPLSLVTCSSKKRFRTPGSASRRRGGCRASASRAAPRRPVELVVLPSISSARDLLRHQRTTRLSLRPCMIRQRGPITLHPMEAASRGGKASAAAGRQAAQSCRSRSMRPGDPVRRPRGVRVPRQVSMLGAPRTVLVRTRGHVARPWSAVRGRRQARRTQAEVSCPA